MKLQFESSQAYQLEAVQAVVDLFEGQPINRGEFEISLAAQAAGLAFNDRGIANQLVLTEEQILRNLRTVQGRNGVEPFGRGVFFAVEIAVNFLVADLDSGLPSRPRFYEVRMIHGSLPYWW